MLTSIFNFSSLQHMQHQASVVEREEQEWREDLQSCEDTANENISQSPDSPIVVSTITNRSRASKKRGRPTKSEEARDWQDDEIYSLIDLWSQKENLYNTKHKDYFNRDIRQKTLSTVQLLLAGRGIEATVKQISEKLTNLKNYYGGQKRLVENSKTSGAGTDQIYQTTWKFFDNLHFLSDAFTPRQTHSNMKNLSPYNIDNSPSTKSSHKIAKYILNEHAAP